jgi:hypothetical protein
MDLWRSISENDCGFWMGPAQSGYSLEARLAGIDHPSHNEASAERSFCYEPRLLTRMGKGLG